MTDSSNRWERLEEATQQWLAVSGRKQTMFTMQSLGGKKKRQLPKEPANQEAGAKHPQYI